MSLSEAEGAAAAATPIQFRRLLAWGALERLAALAAQGQNDYSALGGVPPISDEEQLRSWAGFRERESMTVLEALDVKVHPHFLLWVLMRQELFPDTVLHYWNLGLCRDILADLEASGAAIHVRFEPLLEVLDRYIARRASIGNVRHAWREARYIHDQYQRSGDERSVAAASAIVSVLSDDPEATFRRLLGVAKAHASAQKVYVRHVAVIKRSLQS